METMLGVVGVVLALALATMVFGSLLAGLGALVVAVAGWAVWVESADGW